MPNDQYCVNCKFWNQVETTLQVDPNGIGYSPMAGKEPTKEWGQCREDIPTRYFIPPDVSASNLLQWPVCHEKDWCGRWVKPE